MSKFEHIIKHQSGGTFTYTSPALPTTELEDIDIDPASYMGGSSQSPAEGTGAGPSTPSVDTSEIIKYTGHQGDKRAKVAELQAIQNEINKGTQMNAGFADTRRGMELLSQLQFAMTHMKNDLAREVLLTKEIENTADTNKSKDEYFTRGGNEFLVQDGNGEYGWATWLDIQASKEDGKDQAERLSAMTISKTFAAREHDPRLRGILHEIDSVKGISIARSELKDLASAAGTFSSVNTQFFKKPLSPLVDGINEDDADNRIALIKQRYAGSSNKAKINAAISQVSNIISAGSLNALKSNAHQMVDYKPGMTKEEYIEEYNVAFNALVVDYMMLFESGKTELTNSIVNTGATGSGNVYEDSDIKMTGLELLYSGAGGRSNISVGDEVYEVVELPYDKGTVTRKANNEPLPLYQTELMKDLDYKKYRMKGLDKDKNTQDTWDNYFANSVIVEKETHMLEMYPVDGEGVPVTHFHPDEEKNAKIIVGLMAMEQNKKKAELMTNEADKKAALKLVEEGMAKLKEDAEEWPEGVELVPVMKLTVVAEDRGIINGYLDTDESTAPQDQREYIVANHVEEPERLRRAEIFVPIDKTPAAAILANSQGYLKSSLVTALNGKRDDLGTLSDL